RVPAVQAQVREGEGRPRAEDDRARGRVGCPQAGGLGTLPAAGGSAEPHQRVLRGARVPPAVRLGWVGGGSAPRPCNRARHRADPRDPGAARVVGAGHHGGSEEAVLADRTAHAAARRRGRPARLPRGGPNPVLAVSEGPGQGPSLIRGRAVLTSISAVMTVAAFRFLT